MRRYLFKKKREAKQAGGEKLKNDHYEAITSLPGFTNETVNEQLFKDTFEPLNIRSLFNLEIYGVN